MKTAATGEIKQGAVDGAAMLAHLGLGCLYIGAVEHQQGTPLSRVAAQIRFIETTVQPLIGKGAVVGAVIDKLPAKYGLKEGFGGREITGRKLHIVQFFMGFHMGYLRWRRCTIL